MFNRFAVYAEIMGCWFKYGGEKHFVPTGGGILFIPFSYYGAWKCWFNERYLCVHRPRLVGFFSGG